MVLGRGAPRADYRAQIKCAVPCSDTTRLMEFDTPAVKHGGEDLPILYGLDNMQRHKAILEMDPTKQQLTFPGPGGYTITWSPGTVHIPLHETPSGHLAFAMDDYSNYNAKQTGLKDKQIVLHNGKQAIVPNNGNQSIVPNNGNQATDPSNGKQSIDPNSASSHTRWVSRSHGVYEPTNPGRFQ